MPRKDQQIGSLEKFAIFLAASQTSASASPENNCQSEQDDCDRHERRAGDVSDQDEDDRDDGEDCCDVVVHSFYIMGLRRFGCEPTPCRLCRRGSGVCFTLGARARRSGIMPTHKTKHLFRTSEVLLENSCEGILPTGSTSD